MSRPNPPSAAASIQLHRHHVTAAELRRNMLGADLRGQLIQTCHAKLIHPAR